MSILKKESIPTKEEIMKWTTEIFNQGIRRPGYPADIWVENWIKEKFQSFDLDDINLDPIPIKKWEAEDPKLEIWLIDDPDELIDIPCFPIPYTHSTDSIEAELCMLLEGISVSDKIVVDKIELFKYPVNLLKGLAGTDRWYDPKNEFDHLEQIAPFDMRQRIKGALDPHSEKKALGFIGILSGYPWETDKYYVPYDAIERKIPSVWVSAKNGNKLLNIMAQGIVKGRLSYSGLILDTFSHNITATLPGKSNEWIIIGTHHDGPWNSAVEDASGIALVLAQAIYWSQIPIEKRPFNLMFLMNYGHMTGGVGAQKFIINNKEIIKRTIMAIHLEHVARDVKSENGILIPLDSPTVRWWFVSRILSLEEITEDAIIKEDLQRSIILPPDGLIPGLDRPPTDGSFYHPAKVPFVSFLTAPPYLFDPADTLDKIHEESFEPLTRAVIEL